MIEKIAAAIAAALKAAGLFKKPLYSIWIRKADGGWDNPNPKGNSLRRCGKAIKVYVRHGVPIQSFEILPLGCKPI